MVIYYMLFRVENNQENGGDGKIRNYELSRSELPNENERYGEIYCRRD